MTAKLTILNRNQPMLVNESVKVLIGRLRKGGQFKVHKLVDGQEPQGVTLRVSTIKKVEDVCD